MDTRVSRAKKGWGSCVSPDTLEHLLLADGCGVSRALEEGAKHREHEEKCVLEKDRSKVPHGIVRFQVGARFKLEEFLSALLGEKLTFGDGPCSQEEVTVSDRFEGAL